MSNTLIVPAGLRAESGTSPAYLTSADSSQRSTRMYAQQYLNVQEMQRERLRQAEAQRLRRAAWRARRTLATRLLG